MFVKTPYLIKQKITMKLKNITTSILAFLSFCFFASVYLIIITGIEIVAWADALSFRLSGSMCFAKIKLTAMVAEIRGKLNGTVFSRNSSGAYVRNKVTPVNPNTSFQSNVRADFTTVAQNWRDLTGAQRDAWNQGVVAFSHTDVFGDNVPLSGFNLHQSLNLNLLAVDQVVIVSPPLPGAVFNFTSASLTAAFGLGDLDITFAPAIPAGTSVLLKATAPLSAGKNFVKSELRQIDVLTTADVSPHAAEVEYIAKFGAIGAAGSKLFVELRAIDDTSGQGGGRRLISAIVAA